MQSLWGPSVSSITPLLNNFYPLPQRAWPPGWEWPSKKTLVR